MKPLEPGTYGLRIRAFIADELFLDIGPVISHEFIRDDQGNLIDVKYELVPGGKDSAVIDWSKVFGVEMIEYSRIAGLIKGQCSAVAKTTSGKQCMNEGAKMVDGKWYCGTHAKKANSGGVKIAADSAASSEFDNPLDQWFFGQFDQDISVGTSDIIKWMEDHNYKAENILEVDERLKHEVIVRLIPQWLAEDDEWSVYDITKEAKSRKVEFQWLKEQLLVAGAKVGTEEGLEP